jgi:uncharacterized membrane protein YdjX (TVP38/TMEM64 family)
LDSSTTYSKAVLYGRQWPKSIRDRPKNARSINFLHPHSPERQAFVNGLCFARKPRHLGRNTALTAHDWKSMTSAPPQRNGLIAKLPILVILAVAIAGFFTLRSYASFDVLAEHRDTLIAYRDAHYLLATLAFIGTYVAITAFSLPGAAVISVTGGFLFGLFPGVIYNVVSATIGASIIFLAARTGFGTALSRKMRESGGGAARLQAALQENEWSMLFIMRLVPIVPFFIANLVPAFTGTRLSRFVISTFIGIIPGALVFTSIGSGVGEVFARGQQPDLSILWQPHIIGPILGLAALSALPIFLKRRAP